LDKNAPDTFRIKIIISRKELRGVFEIVLYTSRVDFFSKILVLKVGGNEKNGGSGRSQMLDNGL
jgi:hypothetical protein